MKIVTWKYQLIPSGDIDDQVLLQSDWTRGTTGHTQPKIVVSDATFLWWSLSPRKKNVSHWFIPSRDIDDQRILQFDLVASILGFNWRNGETDVP